MTWDSGEQGPGTLGPGCVAREPCPGVARQPHCLRQEGRPGLFWWLASSPGRVVTSLLWCGRGLPRTMGRGGEATQLAAPAVAGPGWPDGQEWRRGGEGGCCGSVLGSCSWWGAPGSWGPPDAVGRPSSLVSQLQTCRWASQGPEKGRALPGTQPRRQRVGAPGPPSWRRERPWALALARSPGSVPVFAGFLSTRSSQRGTRDQALGLNGGGAECSREGAGGGPPQARGQLEARAALSRGKLQLWPGEAGSPRDGRRLDTASAPGQSCSRCRHFTGGD